MNRGNTTIIIGILVLLIIFAGAYFFTKEAEAPENGTDDTATTTNSTNPAADDSDSMVDDDNNTEDVTVITYTSTGFSPKEVTISVGDTVRFENENGPGMWVASAMHPTHEVYQGTSLSEHCPNEDNTAFDACRDYEAGNNWDFTFTKEGEWGYHNHSRPNHFGKVIVQ